MIIPVLTPCRSPKFVDPRCTISGTAIIWNTVTERRELRNVTIIVVHTESETMCPNMVKRLWRKVQVENIISRVIILLIVLNQLK